MTMIDGKAGTEGAAGTLMMQQGAGYHDRVRDVFEDAPRYLKSRQVDIRFRIDTVRDYAAGIKHERGLDIGCGDGSISRQLILSSEHFTLIDLSSEMVARAKSNLPVGVVDRVEVRNENFATANFDEKQFELVMAVGVMAHVDSTDEFLRKIKVLLVPGGHLILEFTDAFHVVGRIGRFFGWLKELIAPAKYATNKLSYAKVSELLAQHRLKTVSTFRYSRVPFPGFNLVVNHACEYKLLRAFFGNCNKTRNAWLGNEYIFLLRSE